MTVAHPLAGGPPVPGRPAARAPADPATRPTAAVVRVGLHLVLAALPLLTISAHVFGLVPMHVSAGLVVVPLLLAVGLLALFAPAGEERLIVRGLGWGVVATLVYDVVRLDTVYLLGWWGDFIPTVGAWILDSGTAPGVADGMVGYLWRYAGDGGGIGVTFFVLAAVTGLHRQGTRRTVVAAVVFAVVPVWAGLIGTVALAPRGQSLMFPLTPVTLTLSLVGHLVFGLVLGLGCARCGDLRGLWPWPPLVDLDALLARRAGPRPDGSRRAPLASPSVPRTVLRAVSSARPASDDPDLTAVIPPRLPGPATPRGVRRPSWDVPSGALPPAAFGSGPIRTGRAVAPPSDGWGPPECATHGPGRLGPHRPAHVTSSLKAPPARGGRR